MVLHREAPRKGSTIRAAQVKKALRQTARVSPRPKVKGRNKEANLEERKTIPVHQKTLEEGIGRRPPIKKQSSGSCWRGTQDGVWLATEGGGRELK